MEAKDTVSKNPIPDLIVKFEWPSFKLEAEAEQKVNTWVETIRLEQAEISFRAGLEQGHKEVVGFVIEKVFPLLNMASVPVSFKDLWNDKFKEWVK